jgi:hypothetical protein
MKKVLLSALIVVLLAVTSSGCGDARPDFEEVMSEAVAAAAEVQTYSMKMESENRGDKDPENIYSHRGFSDMIDMVTGLEDTEELGDEIIDGVECYHYIGKNKADESVTEQSTSLEYERNYTEFWIGKDDFLLRKVYINEYPGEVESYPGVANFIFSRFNDPIEIEGPVVEEAEDNG